MGRTGGTTSMYSQKPALAENAARTGRFSFGLEGCVEAEDVSDLEGCAVVHHQVAADDYMHEIRRWGRQHRFQLTRARLHSSAQTWGQSSVHNQLTLESGWESIALREPRRQV